MITKSVRGALLFIVLLRFSIPASADRPTNTAVNPATGTYGGATSIQAVLTVGGRPARNENVNFALNGSSVGTATTNSRGVATLNNVSLAGINAGTYANVVSAVFPGDGNLQGSQGTSTLTVNRAAASVTPNAASKKYGAPDPPLTGTLSGFLKSARIQRELCSTPQESLSTTSASPPTATSRSVGSR